MSTATSILRQYSKQCSPPCRLFWPQTSIYCNVFCIADRAIPSWRLLVGNGRTTLVAEECRNPLDMSAMLQNKEPPRRLLKSYTFMRRMLQGPSQSPVSLPHRIYEPMAQVTSFPGASSDFVASLCLLASPGFVACPWLEASLDQTASPPRWYHIRLGAWSRPR